MPQLPSTKVLRTGCRIRPERKTLVTYGFLAPLTTSEGDTASDCQSASTENLDFSILPVQSWRAPKHALQWSTQERVQIPYLKLQRSARSWHSLTAAFPPSLV